MTYSIANNGFGKLPKLRGFGSVLAGTIAFLIYIAIVLSYRSHKSSPLLWLAEDIHVICATISAILLGEFMRSIIIFGEEINHVSTRYSNSFPKAFTACIPFSLNFLGIFKVISSLSMIIFFILFEYLIFILYLTECILNFLTY